MAAPALKGTEEANRSGEVANASATAQTVALPSVGAKAGDVLWFFVQATTNVAKVPTITATKVGGTQPVAQVEGVDEESGGQQRGKLYSYVMEGTSDEIKIATNELCALRTTSVLVEGGAEIKLSSMVQETVAAKKLNSPGVTGLTAGVEYLQINFFGYAAGQLKPLAGWSEAKMATHAAVVFKNTTPGGTSVGEITFEKAGTTTIALVVSLMIAAPIGQLLPMLV